MSETSVRKTDGITSVERDEQEACDCDVKVAVVSTQLGAVEGSLHDVWSVGAAFPPKLSVCVCVRDGEARLPTIHIFSNKWIFPFRGSQTVFSFKGSDFSLTGVRLTD